ncbi:hypothetical protein GUITHDRAFT_149922, partial [Guillardia theta CCMP2712]
MFAVIAAFFQIRTEFQMPKSSSMSRAMNIRVNNWSFLHEKPGQTSVPTFLHSYQHQHSRAHESIIFSP